MSADGSVKRGSSEEKKTALIIRVRRGRLYHVWGGGSTKGESVELEHLG